MRQEQVSPSAAFRANLMRAMARRGLTHEGLATALEEVGVTRSREAITAWVAGRGEPDLDLLPKVAQALKMPIADLIEGYHDQPGPTPEQQAMAEAVARRIEDGPIGLLAKLFGISLEELNTGHDSVKSALDGAPVDPKEQAVVDRFAEVLAAKLAVELKQTLVPALQQTVRESLQRGDDERK